MKRAIQGTRVSHFNHKESHTSYHSGLTELNGMSSTAVKDLALPESAFQQCNALIGLGLI